MANQSSKGDNKKLAEWQTVVQKETIKFKGNCKPQFKRRQSNLKGTANHRSKGDNTNRNNILKNIQNTANSEIKLFSLYKSTKK